MEENSDGEIVVAINESITRNIVLNTTQKPNVSPAQFTSRNGTQVKLSALDQTPRTSMQEKGKVSEKQ